MKTCLGNDHPVFLWVPEWHDEQGQVITGGVQTYALELAGVLQGMSRSVVLVVPGIRRGWSSAQGIPLLTIPPRDWRRGRLAGELRPAGGSVLHIALNAHAGPFCLPSPSIAIQHGIYWDRLPAHRLARLPGVLPMAMAYRSYRGATVFRHFDHLVCVDLAWPTAAKCWTGTLPWDRIHYIPNFAPEPPSAPAPTGKITRIVFSRRFVRHRGVHLAAEVVRYVRRRGWKGEVHLVGCGPEASWLRDRVGDLERVYIYRLPIGQRMEPYTDQSLVLIPSLSTEGTSLTCLEGWSRGGCVLASAVGGLANLVIPGHNGLLLRPVLVDWLQGVDEVLGGRVDAQRLAHHGWLAYQHSFTRAQWRQRWVRVIEEATSRAGTTRDEAARRAA